MAKELLHAALRVLSAYDAPPGEQITPSGWALSSGHVGNVWRPR